MKKLRKRKKKLRIKKNKINEKNKIAINEINNIYEKKIKDKKPIEFIDFILEKYPFKNYDPSKKKKILNNSLEYILKEVLPRYHPDNYKERDNYIIYHEISTLLVNIENSFIKNQ